MEPLRKKTLRSILAFSDQVLCQRFEYRRCEKNKNLGYKKFNRNRLGTITTITHTYLRYLRYLSPYKRFPEEVLLIMIHYTPSYNIIKPSKTIK